MLKIKEQNPGISTKDKGKVVIYHLRTQGSYFKKIICQNEIMGN